jgi:hypothetical protein
MKKKPTWAELDAQMDWEYCLPKKAADELRKRGVPPPPKPKPAEVKKH